jgi:hypothetical protein
VRASRMAPIDTLESLEEILQPLVARRLVVFLTDSERRGAVLTHGFHLSPQRCRKHTFSSSRNHLIAGNETHCSFDGD